MSRPYRPAAAVAWPTALSPTRLRLARVHGRSMLPTLREGDLLLLDRAAPVRPGAVVVGLLPDGTPAVKRVGHREPGGWWLERDNPAEGVDSWQVGAIADGDVLGVVRARLWPRPARLAAARRGGPRPGW
jgi:SOS-response transcriptional repressor LexA